MATTHRTIPLTWAVHFASSRLRAGWRARLTIIAGVLLATVIGALAPLYTGLVAQVGMVQRLAAQPAETVNIAIRSTLAANQPDVDALWSGLNGEIQSAARAAFDPVNSEWLEAVVGWGESAPMFAVRDGADIPDLRLRAAYYDDWEARVEWVERGDPSAGADMTGVISLDLASRFDLSVGDVITLDQRGWDTSIPFTVEITGIVTETESDSPYWMSPSPLRLDTVQRAVEANVLVSRDDVLRVVGEYTPQARGAMGWRALFDHAALAFGRTPQAVEQAGAFERDVERILETENDLTMNYTTGLPNALTSYAAEINLLNAPFGVLILQVGGLVLFFLLITASLAQRGERREVALLQSRGAVDTQIVLLRAIEALIICVLAAVVAPVIARQVLVWLAPLLVDADRLVLELDAQPFIYAAAAGALALVVLLITLRPVLKLPLVSAGGTTIRSARQNWWQRTYLDLLLLIVGTAALFRLLAADSPFARSLLGGLRADPLLLIAPALLFVALGSVTLRLFPPLTDAAARLLTRLRGVSGALATWTVSREPAYYSRIAFLLALAIGIGWFATSFQATLTRSHSDRALYQVGADIRLVERDTNIAVVRPSSPESYAALEGVRSAAVGLRYPDLNFSLDGRQVKRGSLLGIDGAAAVNTAYWRDDLGAFTTATTPDLPQTGVTLPAGTARIGVWMRLEDVYINPMTGELLEDIVLIPTLVGNTNPFVRLRDSSGTFTQVALRPLLIEGREGFDLEGLYFVPDPFFGPAVLETELARLREELEGVSGWVYFEGDVPVTTGDVALDMLYWRPNYDDAQFRPTRRVLMAAGLTAYDDDGAALGDNLLARDDWSLTLDNAVTIEATVAPVQTDKGAGWGVDWMQRQVQTALGIGLYPPAPPIPAVVSAPFAAENALEPGALFDLYIDSRPYTFVVDSTADYFPTLYADQAPFAAADLQALLYALNRRPGAGVYPNEVLIALDEGVDPDAWLEARALNAAGYAVENALTAESVRTGLADDVLALGLSRLLFMGFVIAMILSMINLLVYAALNAQSRRDQFAVLRALGMSSSRIALSVALEQIVVFVVAVLLGAVMGALLSSMVLPSLAISGDGGALTPPFRVEVEVAALAQYFAALTGLLVLVVIASAIIIRRLSLGQALRFQGE